MASLLRRSGAPRSEAPLFERLARGVAAGDRVKALREASEVEPIPDGLLPLLEERLGDPEREVVHAALEAITPLACRYPAAFEGGGWLSAVLERATHEWEAVRAEAAVTLAVLPLDSTLPIVRTLLRLLEDDAPRVRREAAAALGDVGGSLVTGPERARLADLLARHREDADEETRFEAAFALGALGDSRGLELLIAALGSSTRRLDACDALKRLGDPAAVPVLRRLVKSVFLGWPERLTAWATLYSLGERDAAEKLIERTRAWNRQERALALALIGSHRVVEGAAVLAAVARDPQDVLQDGAVRALGDLGDPAQAATLLAVAEDAATPLDVRLDAVEAVAKLEGGPLHLTRLRASSSSEVAARASKLSGGTSAGGDPSKLPGGAP